MRAGDNSLAEQVLRSLVQSKPGDLQARLLLAQFLLETDKADQAQPVLEQLVKDQPNNAQALESLARLQLTSGNYAGALQSAATLQSLQANNVNAILIEGVANEALKKPVEARKAYERAFAADPRSSEAIVALSRFEVGEGKAAQALQRIDAALVQQPNDAQLHAIRGDVLLAQRRFVDAAASYAAALKANPGWVQAYRSQALAYQAAGQPDQAIASLRAGLEATKGSEVIAMDLGTQLERAGRHDEAIKVFEDMLAKNPAQQLALNNLAMMLVTHRKDEASFKRAGELVQPFKDSDNPAFLDTYGWVMYRLGRHAEAVAALGKAVEKVPNAPELRYHLGMAQLETGDKKGAQENLEAALASKAEFPGVGEARAAVAALAR